MAKTAAAYSRRQPKDWYDIALMLLHNDAGGPEQAAAVVLEHFGGEITGSIRTAIEDLNANFAIQRPKDPPHMRSRSSSTTLSLIVRLGGVVKDVFAVRSRATPTAGDAGLR